MSVLQVMLKNNLFMFNLKPNRDLETLILFTGKICQNKIVDSFLHEGKANAVISFK